MNIWQQGPKYFSRFARFCSPDLSPAFAFRLLFMKTRSTQFLAITNSARIARSNTEADVSVVPSFPFPLSFSPSSSLPPPFPFPLPSPPLFFLQPGVGPLARQISSLPEISSQIRFGAVGASAQKKKLCRGDSLILEHRDLSVPHSYSEEIEHRPRPTKKRNLDLF